MQPTLVTWFLIVFGVITIGTASYIYLVFLRDPHSQKSKDLMLGKSRDWRDKTHFRLELGFAWIDLLFLVPLFVSGCVGMLISQPWGTCSSEWQAG
ncbi:MAG: hypothetical protein ACYS6K_19380 [Planctomycetota bacterium]|jgi:hypothetical protein